MHAASRRPTSRCPPDKLLFARQAPALPTSCCSPGKLLSSRNDFIHAALFCSHVRNGKRQRCASIPRPLLLNSPYTLYHCSAPSQYDNFGKGFGKDPENFGVLKYFFSKSAILVKKLLTRIFNCCILPDFGIYPCFGVLNPRIQNGFQILFLKIQLSDFRNSQHLFDGLIGFAFCQVVDILSVGLFRHVKTSDIVNQLRG